MQEFFINKNSVNPVLRLELINDGVHDYQKSLIYDASIQNADITFSMQNVNNGILKISKSKAEIIPLMVGCETKHIIQYSWKPRDVNESGVYRGWFEIKYKGDLKYQDIIFPIGNYIIPIEEELIINVK